VRDSGEGPRRRTAAGAGPVSGPADVGAAALPGGDEARTASGGAGDGRATIARVAAAAGVSRATVSRVMNGQRSVDPELASRVRTAAERLRYEPSAIAQSLARGRTGLVGIVVPDLANPMFQAILRGVSDEAGAADHRVLVADTHEDRDEEAILAREVRRRCDALVLCSPRMPDDELAELLPGLAPVVLANRRLDATTVPSVSIDHASGMRAIAHHLTSLGHRRVAYLMGPGTSWANRERLAALRWAAEERFSLLEFEAGAMFEDGFDNVDRAVAAGVTAIVGYNDLVAYGALARLYELGVGVPDTVSVTGFDDIPFARYATPPLTTVVIPKEDLGREAWYRLAAMLAGTEPPADASFAPRLVVRASTGPVGER
jgi:LacI family transcriptional regulator